MRPRGGGWRRRGGRGAAGRGKARGRRNGDAVWLGMGFAGGGGDGMGIERVEAGCDEGWVRECYEIFCAAQAVDDPEGPPMGRAVFEGWMRWGWASDPRETWV